MPLYKEQYLEGSFDNFEWFDPQCRDRRIREINMRTKRCLPCPGFEACQKYPEYWLKGHTERQRVNEGMEG